MDRKPELGDLAYVALLAILSIAVKGYVFGSEDQPQYLALLRQYADASALPPGDILTGCPIFKMSLFWLGIHWLLKVVELQWLFFGVYVTSILAAFIGTYCLALLLFGRKLAAYLAVLLFMSELVPGKPYAIYSASLRNLVVALPFSLFAYCAFLEGKYVRSAVLIGLAFLLHPVSAAPAAYVLLVRLVWDRRRIGWRPFVRWLAVVASISLVLVLYGVSAGVKPRLALMSEEWAGIVRARTPYDLFSAWRGSDWLSLGVLLLAVGISLVRQPPSSSIALPTFFIAAAGSLCVVAFVFSDLLPVTLVVQLHLNRATATISLFTFLLLANHIEELLLAPPRYRLLGVCLLVSLIAWGRVTTIGLLVASLSYRLRDRPALAKGLVAGGVALMGFALAAITLRWEDAVTLLHGGTPWYAPWEQRTCLIVAGTVVATMACDMVRPKEGAGQRRFLKVAMPLALLVLAPLKTMVPFGVLVSKPRTSLAWRINFPHTRPMDDWLDVQLWAKENTPKSSLFMVPMDSRGFRVFSERGQVISRKDGAPVVYDESFAREWRDRALAFEELERNWRDIGDVQVSFELGVWQLAAKYGFHYALLRKPKRLSIASVYENASYIVYKIHEPT